MTAVDTTGRGERAGLCEVTDSTHTKYSLAQTYYNRGVAYARQGQWEKAIEEWQKVVSLTPYDVACRNALAIVYEESGQPDLAWQQLEAALRCAPGDARTLANRQHLRGTYGCG